MTFPTNIPDLDTTRADEDTDKLNAPNHLDHHKIEDDNLEAVMAKIGVDGSAVATSHDYKLAKVEVEHNTSGTHKAATVTTLKATGAEINTGTEDAKIVTPKAIADSNVSFPTKTETLTNKLAITITGEATTRATRQFKFDSASSIGGLLNFTQTFVNLSTTPVAYFGGNDLAYLMMFFQLTNVDGDNCNFQINSSIQAGVAFRFNHVLGSGCAITESSEGVFAISGLGDGKTYTLTFSTGGCDATLVASGATTGNTKLRMIALGY